MENELPEKVKLYRSKEALRGASPPSMIYRQEENGDVIKCNLAEMVVGYINGLRDYCAELGEDAHWMNGRVSGMEFAIQAHYREHDNAEVPDNKGCPHKQCRRGMEECGHCLGRYPIPSVPEQEDEGCDTRCYHVDRKRQNSWSCEKGKPLHQPNCPEYKRWQRERPEQEMDITVTNNPDVPEAERTIRLPIGTAPDGTLVFKEEMTDSMKELLKAVAATFQIIDVNDIDLVRPDASRGPLLRLWDAYVDVRDEQ